MGLNSQVVRPAASSPLTIDLPSSFDATWRGFGGLHGGLVAGILLHATAAELDAVPAAITAHFYAPVPPGRVEVNVESLRSGRTAGARASLGNGEVTGLVRLVRDLEPARWSSPSTVPEVDPWTRPVLEIPVDFVPFSQYLDIRPINAARPFGGGTDPTFEVWIRLRPDVLLPPTVRAAVLLDALPPGLFATRTAPVPIPTAEFTAHLAPAAHDPDGEWFHLRQHTTWASADLCVDDTELRRPTGELVAQGRQLRRIMGG
ncbi:thioesterase family protein [Rhodococcus sp. O3]|uniref:thioesterase family protein n=1 Tax=Rhodococcus sp. O3 TaxID=3404919 RepID=UPI003B66CDDC